MSAAVNGRFRARARSRASVTLVALVLAWLAASPVSAQQGDAEPAFLGVQLQEASRQGESGALVTRVIEGSPAAEAGVRVGDFVIEFEGKPIDGPVALTQRIQAVNPGARVRLTVLREEATERIEVELGQRATKTGRWSASPRVQVEPREISPRAPMTAPEPPEPPELLEVPDPEIEVPERFFEGLVPEPRDLSRYLEPLRWEDKPRLGVQLVETTPELRRHLGGSDQAGVLVSKILAGMPAERAGLRVGDLIVGVDGEPVASSSELIRALRDKPGLTFPIDVVRDGKSLALEVTIPEPESERPTGPRA